MEVSINVSAGFSSPGEKNDKRRKECVVFRAYPLRTGSRNLGPRVVSMRRSYSMSCGRYNIANSCLGLFILQSSVFETDLPTEPGNLRPRFFMRIPIDGYSIFQPMIGGTSGGVVSRLSKLRNRSFIRPTVDIHRNRRTNLSTNGNYIFYRYFPNRTDLIRKKLDGMRGTVRSVRFFRNASVVE